MSDMARKTPSFAAVVGPQDDEGSVIRPRNAPDSGRPTQRSLPELKTDPGPSTKRGHSTTRPASGSLADRLERKMRLAGDLMRDLPSTDARVRLLYIAIMRRDEALLDGVLAELNKSGHGA